MVDAITSAIDAYRNLLDRQARERLQAADALRDAYIAIHMSDARCARLTTGQMARVERVGRYDVRLQVLHHFSLRDRTSDRFGRPVFGSLMLRRRDGREYGSDPASPVLLDPATIERLVEMVDGP